MYYNFIHVAKAKMLHKADINIQWIKPRPRMKHQIYKRTKQKHHKGWQTKQTNIIQSAKYKRTDKITAQKFTEDLNMKESVQYWVKRGNWCLIFLYYYCFKWVYIVLINQGHEWVMSCYHLCLNWEEKYARNNRNNSKIKVLTEQKIDVFVTDLSVNTLNF